MKKLQHLNISNNKQLTDGSLQSIKGKIGLKVSMVKVQLDDSAGHSAFGYTGPRLWNDLPAQLRKSTSSVPVFWKQLKTINYLDHFRAF